MKKEKKSKAGAPTKYLDWKKINSDDFFKNYVVSKCGKIKNIKTGNILKPYKMKKGHMQVSISRKGIVKKFLLHRLVAIAFINNPENKPCINHIDGNPENNKIENLEWCTDRENKTHAKENKMFQQSTNRYNSKFDDCQILTIHTLKIPHQKIADHYKVSQSVITRIKNFFTYSDFAVIYDK